MQTFVKELCLFREGYVDTTSIISELMNDVAKKIQGHLGTGNTKAVSLHDFTLHLRIFETYYFNFHSLHENSEFS